MPDEGSIRSLFAVSTMHGVVTPRAVSAAAQRDTADNDDDLWLCADGCTHHSDHLSIFQRAVQQHRPLDNRKYIPRCPQSIACVIVIQWAIILFYNWDTSFYIFNAKRFGSMLSQVSLCQI